VKLQSKKNKSDHITVNAKKNKILVNKGFVRITKGTHYGHETIRPDLLEEYYQLPQNAKFSD